MFGNRKAGDNKNLFVDAYGVVRTIPGLPGTDTSGLKLDTIDGALLSLLTTTEVKCY